MNMALDTVWDAWKKRQGPAVFVAVASDGVPNAIYVTCVKNYNDRTVLITDSYFHKTPENLGREGVASLLFITDERKSFQVKGTVSYADSGPYHAFMRECLDPKYPVAGVAILSVEEAYSGAEQLL